MTTVDELLIKLFHAPKVLVVANVADEVKARLREDYGCHVDTTDNSSQVLKLLLSGEHDLALLDLETLNETGEAVLKAVQIRCPRTPVAAVVGQLSDAEQMFRQTGAIVLLRKPVTHDTLDRLFHILKIKVRTPAMVEYCEHLSRSATMTGLTG